MKKITFFSICLIFSVVSFSQKLPQTNFKGNFIYTYVFPNISYSSEAADADCSVTPQPICNYIANPNYNSSNYSHPIDPFNNNEVPNWLAASGSPTVYDPINFPMFPSPPPGVSGYFFAGVSEGGTIGSGDYICEGVVQKIPKLIPGHTYALSFFKSTFDYSPYFPVTYPLDILHVTFINCSDYNATFDPHDWHYPPVPANRQDVYCETNVTNTNDNWQQVFVHFTATSDYNMIWIWPEENRIAGRFASLFFTRPELIDITAIQNQVIQATQPSCMFTLPSCGPINSIFNWQGPSGQTISAPSGQPVQFVANSLTVGTWTLTLTVPTAVITNNTCSQNSSVTATVNIDECAPPNIWPKIYESSNQTPYSILGKYICGNPSTGNIYAYVSANMSNNINHSGTLPATPGSYLTHYSSTTGITNWFHRDEIVGFILSNGNFQSILHATPFITVFRDGVTGVITSGPSLVPSNEVILAEDNGTYITTSNTDLHVRSSTGTSIIPFLTGYLFPYQNKYDPVTKRFFVKYSKASSTTQSPDAIAVYELANNTLTLLRTFIPPTLNWSTILQVNKDDKVFLSSDGNIYKYDYITNIYSLYSISGLNNNGSITPIYDASSYVADDLMSFNWNDGYIYYINTFINQLKKIQYTLPSNSSMWVSYYKDITNNDVYLAGSIEGFSGTIGTQIYALPGNVAPAFVTKFNIQTEFSFLPPPIEGLQSKTGNSAAIMSSVQQNKTKEEILPSVIDATLSPNPVKNILQVNVKQNVSKETESILLISITNSLGINVVRLNTKQRTVNVDISKFRTGIYYVTISNIKGDKTTQTFIKE